MRELMGIVGIVVAVQGMLGFCGLTFDDEAWGVLHNWFDLPAGAYAGIALAGLVLAVWGEGTRRARRA
ncbi:hypothetical protein LRS74_14180 [Streptomyces sp. LX-29]|uniref:hypothetical protein n=1 Tax=Streptomyces sp. LX-29 TaxID=2900152 RepID=UPI00240D504E|nr:hypothetical protein [Streptomyces sp. LX-29]WFB08072.1 hypothetical protein LRS74_14180 [Streptomyces sp. LX-29]